MDLDIINEDETGGQIKMCRAFTEIRREGYRSGQRKGRKKGREEMLHNIIASAISNNVGFEVIQTLTGLSLDEITSIAKTLEPAQA